jgi:hypothetical protein
VTDGPPPEYRCPICGDLNVNPHLDSLCPKHYPGDAPEITPLDKPSAGLSNHAPTLDEARAVTRTDEPRDEDGFFEREHALLDRHEESQPEAREDEDTGTSDSDESFLVAAMGDSAAAEAYTDDEPQDSLPDRGPGSSDSSDVATPMGAILLGQLDAIFPEQRRRAARKRGYDWPTTEEAHDRLRETIHEVLRNEGNRVVDAPTSLGEAYTIAATRWGARDNITGGRARSCISWRRGMPVTRPSKSRKSTVVGT